MSRPEREIPQRELRNNVAGVLREVEAGAHLRITVGGRAVADLVPVPRRKRFVPAAVVQRILSEAPLDPRFARDLARALPDTTDDL